jgi:hypothetical protein
LIIESPGERVAEHKGLNAGVLGLLMESVFKICEILGGEGVCFGDEWDDIA